MLSFSDLLTEFTNIYKVFGGGGGPRIDGA